MVVDTDEVVIIDVGAIGTLEMARMGVPDDDVVVIDSKDEVEDAMAVGRVLAPASYSLASSFSARRVTSANFAEIASTAVRLLSRIEASSASDILEKQIC